MRKFNYDLKSSTYTDELLISSCIGKLTSTKLALTLPEQRELSLNEIAFFELKKQQVNKFNYLLGLFGLVALAYGFYWEVIYLFVVSLLFVLFALFSKRSQYYVQIILRNPEKIFIKIAKRDFLDLTYFSKKVNDSINKTAITMDVLKPAF